MPVVDDVLEDQLVPSATDDDADREMESVTPTLVDFETVSVTPTVSERLVPLATLSLTPSDVP